MIVKEISTVSEAKYLPDGTRISLSNMIATTDQTDFSKSIYIEDANRVAGIRVCTSDTVSGLVRGSTVTVKGYMATASARERQIESAVVSVDGFRGELSPLGMNSFAAAGQGLGVTGLLVRVFGEITAVETDYVTIDDGGMPILIDISKLNMGYTVGEYLTASGLCSLTTSGDDIFTVVLPRDDSDITPYQSVNASLR